MYDRKEKTVVELESGSMHHRGKGAAGWYMDRGSKRYSTKGGQAKGYQKNIQNVERSVAEYWGRENGCT